MKNYSYIGNDEILKNHKLAFFCSQKCPPDIILKIYDKAKEWRENKVCVISGFHTPVEKDVLHYLLKGEQPVIICPARSLDDYRIDVDIKEEINNGRVLVISKLQNRRISKKYSNERNLFIADLADEIFIGYSEPGGTVEKTCEYARTMNKKVYSFSYL
ncbi:MAG: DNA-binding protein [Ignavibacteria bacterium]|nr:DNA-binding protein [Ignavibacteria bacterium]